MGNLTPRVSVVLPTQNRGGVVGGAMESVLDQTYDDLELLVVDGGSDDETPAVVGEFDDPRLTYLRKPRGEGVSAARNEGLRLADGDLVAFVDADDRWRPEKLRAQVRAYRAADDPVVVTAGIEKAHGEPLTREGVDGDARATLRRLDAPTYTSILLARRDAVRAVGGFDESLPCFEDWDLCMQLAREGSFAHVPETLVVKGTTGDNVSADPDALFAALPRIFERYDLPPAARAQFLADAGVTACEAGRFESARPYLRRALRLDWRRNAAAALALSYASPRAFDVGMNALYAVERAATRHQN